jgi:hypothetical protein
LIGENVTRSETSYILAMIRDNDIALSEASAIEGRLRTNWATAPKDARRFQVVGITNDIENNPEFAEDTWRFLYLVEEVEDEVGYFIIDLSTGEAYPAGDFFLTDVGAEIKYFFVETPK